MDANTGLKPSFLKRDGVRLAYFEAGAAHVQTPPLILVNGWTGDHRIFTPQIDHFAKSRRVVAIDLRGHGASDAPKQEYTMAGFADDIAWQCAELGLHRPVVIGHSDGVEMARQHRLGGHELRTELFEPVEIAGHVDQRHVGGNIGHGNAAGFGCGLGIMVEGVPDR